jgi:hypothetical protein
MGIRMIVVIDIFPALKRLNNSQLLALRIIKLINDYRQFIGSPCMDNKYEVNKNNHISMLSPHKFHLKSASSSSQEQGLRQTTPTEVGDERLEL